MHLCTHIQAATGSFTLLYNVFKIIKTDIDYNNLIIVVTAIFHNVITSIQLIQISSVKGMATKDNKKNTYTYYDNFTKIWFKTII